MTRIVIIGAGVMGSALSVPATDNANEVLLVGTHLDRNIIECIKHNHHHPGLDERLPSAVEALHHDELTAAHLQAADIVVLGVSSAGVDWALKLLAGFALELDIVSLVTKGLEPAVDQAPQTYAHTLQARLAQAGVASKALVGIGGPCIAREIVLRQPTAVVYAASDATALECFVDCMQTPSYRVFRSHDIVGVEACAALKNFLAIGVSAMISRYRTAAAGAESQSAKNPTAAAFNQAVREMAILAQWIGGERDTAFDHAGMGDLHVTVGGGRNSRLGICLGQGMTLRQALQGPLLGQTVEGSDTGRVLAPALYAAIEQQTLQRAELALSLSILRVLEADVPFEFDFSTLAQH